MSRNNVTTYVGMDVHKKSINVAVRIGRDKEVVEQWQMANELKSIKKMVRQVEGMTAGGKLEFAYEAGPCGYALQRQLGLLGMKCMVVAPSHILTRPGVRVKTDRRDAMTLAEQLQNGLLTEVCPPTQEEEAVRDLSRAREDGKEDLMRARHRLSKFLLKRGYAYRQGDQWTRRHWEWVRSIRLEEKEAQQVLNSYVLAIEQIEDRVQQLTGYLEEAAQSDRYREQVGWLRCLRGVDTVVAMTILSELHDFRRFTDSRKLMSYLGLTPSEYSTGGNENRGRITKTGNRHVRRVLIQAAWNYRHRPSVSKVMQGRRVGQPPEVIAIADRAQVRLHGRYFKMKEVRMKNHNKVVTAIARELVGFIWSVLWHQHQQLTEDVA